MERMLWEICRDAKAEQRLTYQQIADAAGLSVNAVSQYLRGETKARPCTPWGRSVRQSAYP